MRIKRALKPYHCHGKSDIHSIRRTHRDATVHFNFNRALPREISLCHANAAVAGAYEDLKTSLALQSFPDLRLSWLSFSSFVAKSQGRQQSLDDADTSIATIKRSAMLAKDNFIAREDG